MTERIAGWLVDQKVMEEYGDNNGSRGGNVAYRNLNERIVSTFSERYVRVEWTAYPFSSDISIELDLIRVHRAVITTPGTHR